MQNPELNTSSCRNTDNLAGVELLFRMYGRCNPRWGEALLTSHADQLSRWSEQVSVPHPLPNHVFPVVSSLDSIQEGLMLEVSVRPSQHLEGWRLSDAFGSMGWRGGRTGGVLDDILALIDAAWRKGVPGKTLPLRWRYPLHFALDAPVHIDTVDGESLQFPLLLSLLRSCVARMPRPLPFGEGPVFCSASLNTEGRLLPVNDLQRKAEGFLREYGTGRTALLTPAQTRCLKPLGTRFEIHEVQHLSDVLSLPQFKSSLEDMCESPPESELDSLMQALRERKHFRQFGQVREMTSWLLACTTNRPLYQFTLRLQRLSTSSYQRHLREQAESYTAAHRLLRKPEVRGHVGLNDYLDAVTLCVNYFLQLARPQAALCRLRRLRPFADLLSVRRRAAFWGSCCRVLCVLGRLDDAVSAGQKALENGLAGNLGEVHRGANFLINALLLRAQARPETRGDTLAHAKRLLGLSEGDFAPWFSEGALSKHRLFCGHLHAEIARLNGEPHLELPALPQGAVLETWEHPVFYTHFSAVRNPVNPLSFRIQSAQTLLRQMSAYGLDEQPVLQLLFSAYDIYRQSLEFPDAKPSLKHLESAMELFDRNAEDPAFFSPERCAQACHGWHKRLSASIRVLETASEPASRLGAAEHLCELTQLP